MSIPCMNRVWEQSNQKGAALLLLVALADYATCFPLTKTGSNGLAWPGIETLALDWLEHRLAGRIRHILAFFLPGIEVRFVAPGTTGAPQEQAPPGPQTSPNSPDICFPEKPPHQPDLTPKPTPAASRNIPTLRSPTGDVSI